MARTIPLSFRVSAERAQRIDRLSKATDRPRSWVLEQALDAYLDSQEWQITHIQRGLAEIERGEGVAHDKVEKWLAGWGDDREDDAPR
jgi:predicted transcriptional regulator